MSEPGGDAGLGAPGTWPADLTVGAAVPEGRRRYGPVELFLFSAAGWHPHRIHYDLPYAQHEGHPELLVHGPLQAVHMFQHLEEVGGPGVVFRSVTYRHARSLYVGDTARIGGRVIAADGGDGSVTLEVWMENQKTGERTTSGTAVVATPPQGAQHPR